MFLYRPGNWLEEGLRLACTPEDMKAAGAGGHITEASLQKPYADMVPSTQNVSHVHCSTHEA
jgi:hypothetical protein